MTFISYAQNFEDVILRRVFPDMRHGFYVDAGAWDPVRESVTKAFYDLGWYGINIEPSPAFDRLASARARDINLRIALGERPGEMALRVYRDAHEVLQASTLVPAAPPRIDRPADLRASDVMVQVLPLAKVLDQHAPGQHIHFLKIDVEGAEEAVIRGADWRRHRPEVVVIEATRPQSTERSDGPWRPLLLAAGYVPVLFDGLNAWFLREESRERESCFATPPNVFDNFRRHDPAAEQRIAAAEARAEELEARLDRQEGARGSLHRLLAPLRRMVTGRGGGARQVTPEAFVRVLYRACLGRPPEPEGLAGWVEHLAQADGLLEVARAIATSPEAQARAVATARRQASAELDGSCDAVARVALDRLGRRPRIIDIGARMLDTEAHVYDGLRRISALDVIGFDPMAARMAERRAREGEEGLTLLPYAIGDGGAHLLHINTDDSTTSLFPLDLEHNAPLNHLQTLRTVRTEPLQTRRLDDVLPDGPVDFLKLDIQGGELMALRHAAATLARTAVVHCEVEFSPIYAGQPLFAEVQALLAGHGFALIDLVNPARYHYARWAGQEGQAEGERLVWADAVFFRTTHAPEMLAAQALVAAQIYRKVTLARHLLSEAGGVQHSGQSEPTA